MEHTLILPHQSMDTLISYFCVNCYCLFWTRSCCYGYGYWFLTCVVTYVVTGVCVYMLPLSRTSVSGY